METSWTLENAGLQLRIASLGAEMVSLYSKATAREWLWRPRKAVWQSVSPILFPVVGRLIRGGLWEEERFYPLPAHGFLRHLPFRRVQQSSDALSLRGCSNATTLAQWPFDFGFEAQWRLKKNGVQISYCVENTEIVVSAFLWDRIRGLLCRLFITPAGAWYFPPPASAARFPRAFARLKCRMAAAG